VVSAGRKNVFVAKTQAASPATPNAKNDTSRRDSRLGFRIPSRMTFPPDASQTAPFNRSAARGAK
jgi:hypothetical protein